MYEKRENVGPNLHLIVIAMRTGQRATVRNGRPPLPLSSLAAADRPVVLLQPNSTLIWKNMKKKKWKIYDWK